MSKLESSNDVPDGLDDAFAKAIEFSSHHSRPNLLMFEVGVLWMHKKVTDLLKLHILGGGTDPTLSEVLGMLEGIQSEFDSFHAKNMPAGTHWPPTRIDAK